MYIIIDAILRCNERCVTLPAVSMFFLPPFTFAIQSGLISSPLLPPPPSPPHSLHFPFLVLFSRTRSEKRCPTVPTACYFLSVVLQDDLGGFTVFATFSSKRSSESPSIVEELCIVTLGTSKRNKELPMPLQQQRFVPQVGALFRDLQTAQVTSNASAFAFSLLFRAESLFRTSQFDVVPHFFDFRSFGFISRAPIPFSFLLFVCWALNSFFFFFT